MKKRICLITSIILIIVCGVVYNFCLIHSINTKVEVGGYTLYTKKANISSNNPQIYYTDINRKIYLVGLKEINLKKDNESISLKSYLKDNNLNKVFEDILNNLNKESSLWDGGTNIYRNKKNDITIIMCNTIDGNKDIYIGNKKMEMQDKYCKS